ncbi:MAG: dprA [Glaciihabitans sp.]|nr:dprA [Glaciihabitans sp.]
MTMFGLKEAEVATLTRAVAGDNLDRDGIREAFARATWTGLAEPGDRLAVFLVQALGAARALDVVVDRTPVSEVLEQLRQLGAEEIPAGELQLALDRWMPRLVAATALLAMRQAARHGAGLLTPDAEGWPQGVNDLGPHAPIALWCRGTGAALAALPASIALVGARAATGYGEHVAMEASAGLVDRGFAIVSGAAYGIDGMAHRAALASNGMTVAFLAGGVDRFYPSGHDALLARIVEVGAVISELPCGQPPTKWRFLQRNRLIAAASQATVVLEAGWRSGSLNTAGHAGQMGRPVGAVPGPVTSAASAGCHRLIRSFAATLVTNAEEMAELVAPFSAGVGTDAPMPSAGRASGPRTEVSPNRAERPRTSDETRILDALSVRSPRTSTDIAARSGLSVATAQSVLATLELEGVTVERERGWMRRTGGDG